MSERQQGESAATPGPWSARFDPAFGLGAYIEGGPSGELIAASITHPANAYLLAAAPELRDACKQALAVLTAEFGNHRVEVNFPYLRAALKSASAS